MYPTCMVSSLVSRISAGLLALGGATLLFAADAVLPVFVPGFPVRGAWLGQLLGTAWLGMATLNWLQRFSLLGGIYGRAIVMANAMLYVAGATSLIKPLLSGRAPATLLFVFVPMTAMAIAYAALMLRGPFDPLGNRNL